MPLIVLLTRLSLKNYAPSSALLIYSSSFEAISPTALALSNMQVKLVRSHSNKASLKGPVLPPGSGTLFPAAIFCSFNSSALGSTIWNYADDTSCVITHPSPSSLVRMCQTFLEAAENLSFQNSLLLSPEKTILVPFPRSPSTIFPSVLWLVNIPSHTAPLPNFWNSLLTAALPGGLIMC